MLGYCVTDLSGDIIFSASTRKTISTSGVSVVPVIAGNGAGPDDEDHDDPAEDLAHRAGQEREALGADDPLAVPLRLVVEPPRLPRLAAVGPDHPDRTEPLGHRGGELPCLLRAGPGVAPQPLEQLLDGHHQQRCRAQGQQGQPPRDRRQDARGSSGSRRRSGTMPPAPHSPPSWSGRCRWSSGR